MGSRITQKLACCEKEGGDHTGVSEHKPRGRREAPGEQRLHTDTDGEVAEVHTVCWTWPETGRRAVQLQPRLHVTIRNMVHGQLHI